MVDDRPCDEDRSVLERVQRGDEQAIELLYDRHSSVVYSIALRVLGDPALAEQILLDLFLQIWRRPKLFLRSANSFSFSLLMTARNLAIAMLLQKPADPDFAPPDRVADHGVQTVTREEACVAIEKLPIERRIMLERAFFDGVIELVPASLKGRRLETDEVLLTAMAGLPDSLLTLLPAKTNEPSEGTA